MIQVVIKQGFIWYPLTKFEEFEGHWTWLEITGISWKTLSSMPAWVAYTGLGILTELLWVIWSGNEVLHSPADGTNTPQSSEALVWGHVWERLSDAWCHSSQYRAVKMGSWEGISVAKLLATLAWELEFEYLRLTLKKADGWSWDVAQ